MESLEEFIEVTAGIFIFCLAISLFFYTSKELDKLLLTTKNNLNSYDVLYEQRGSEEYNSYISYTELVGTLIGDIQHDIQVNNLEFIAGIYDYLNFDYLLIPDTKYSIEYFYDDNGNIIKVKYISI